MESLTRHQVYARGAVQKRVGRTGVTIKSSKLAFTGCEFYSDYGAEISDADNAVLADRALKVLRDRGYDVAPITPVELLDVKDASLHMIDLCVTEGPTEYRSGDTLVYRQDTLSVLLRVYTKSGLSSAPNKYKSEIEIYERFSVETALTLLDSLLAVFPKAAAA